MSEKVVSPAKYNIGWGSTMEKSLTTLRVNSDGSKRSWIDVSREMNILYPGEGHEGFTKENCAQKFHQLKNRAIPTSKMYDNLIHI